MRSVTLVALASALSSFAGAQCTIVTTPSAANFSGNFTGYAEAGMLEGEAAAVTFTLAPEAFPIKLKLTEMIFVTSNATVPTTTIWRVFGYEGAPNVGTLVFDETADGTMLPYLQMGPGTNGTNIQFSVDPQDPDQIIFQDNGSHTVTIGYGIVQHNNQTTIAGLPYLPTDSNAFTTVDTQLTYASRNWLFAVPHPFGAPAGWSAFSSLSTAYRPSGDWNIRFSYESLNPVSITDDPDNQHIPLGQTATFNVVASGADLQYRWYKDGDPLPTNGSHYFGVTGPGLAIVNTVANDAGNYNCVVSSTCGQVTSQAATLSFVGTTAVVSGQATLNDFTGSPNGRPFLLRFRTPGQTLNLASVAGSLNAFGNYSVVVPASVTPGTYDLYMDIQHWLRRKVGSVVLSGSGASGVNFTLQNGDAVDDGEVGPQDIDAVISNFGTSDTMCDMNGSGEVDPIDIDIVIGNFGGQDD